MSRSIDYSTFPEIIVAADVFLLRRGMTTSVSRSLVTCTIKLLVVGDRARGLGSRVRQGHPRPQRWRRGGSALLLDGIAAT